VVGFSPSPLGSPGGGFVVKVGNGITNFLVQMLPRRLFEYMGFSHHKFKGRVGVVCQILI